MPALEYSLTIVSLGILGLVALFAAIGCIAGSFRMNTSGLATWVFTAALVWAMIVLVRGL